MGIAAVLLGIWLVKGAVVDPLLPPGPGNPRNTEGAFVSLRDGRILFAYTRFTGGGDDGDAATIVGRYSRDRGRTWDSRDTPIVANEGGLNVMSVSLLRLGDGRIALFYLRKNSAADCRPYVRFSRDEARNWSEPVEVIAQPNYYVLNNDRVIQLRTGRLVMPLAFHASKDGRYLERAVAMAYLSDDAGATWRRARTALECPTPSDAGLQEPGVVELKDGRILMWMRTRLGSQYTSHSTDGGETWSPAQPSNIRSPLSPASIKRIPSTGDLLIVWNDQAVDSRRTPLTLAISPDEGETWIHKQNLLDAADGWYCYTAIHFTGKEVLLSFNAGGEGLPKLSRSSMARFNWKELYRAGSCCGKEPPSRPATSE